ncbi:MAG: FAD-dependent monooxygenase [Chthoniobacterales bacterium]|nr:FAD-dependent monooxygenase [Chthoniobacterales bacterium]
MTANLPVPLIVGAGPVGLTLANELARHGVRCRIIDQAPERSQTSKALAIFPRTLEAFSAMGVADRFLAAGERIQGLAMHHGGERLAAIDLDSVASPFPFVLSLPQSETECLLSERLAGAGIEVEREVSLTSIEQTNDFVRATLRHPDGREEIVQTPWLLGCDGAHSTTRHALGMEFAGSQYDESFILADVRIESAPDRRHVHLYLGPEGVFGLIPFGGDRWRIVANIPPESRNQNLPELMLDDVQTVADARGPAGARLSDPTWISRFHISHRIVPQFRKLRVFLLGDAAHIHSPAGGQGMNTGIQDAFNLAWKLALVVRGLSPVQLLGSFHTERVPVARGVLNLTDRITRMATTRNSVAQSVRDFLLPVVSGIDLVGEKVADRLAELGVNYRQSPFVENVGGGRLRAGDRAPDAELRDANGQARRLFEIFRAPRHVLLLFLGAGFDADEKMELLCSAWRDLPPEALESHRILRGEGDAQADLRDLSGLAHSAYGLVEGGIVLVRPDGYLGYRSDEFEAASLRAYLERIFRLGQ